MGMEKFSFIFLNLLTHKAVIFMHKKQLIAIVPLIHVIKIANNLKPSKSK